MCSRIKPDYDQILRNVPIYSKRKRLVAEIDILALKEGKYDIYEVKCSHRIYKARKQLAKIKKLLARESKNVGNAYFYCGESMMIHNINEFLGYGAGAANAHGTRKMSSAAIEWMQIKQ